MVGEGARLYVCHWYKLGQTKCWKLIFSFFLIYFMNLGMFWSQQANSLYLNLLLSRWLPFSATSVHSWTLRSRCQEFCWKSGCRVWFPEAEILIGWQVLQSVQFVNAAKTTPWNDALSRTSLNDSCLFFLFWESIFAFFCWKSYQSTTSQVKPAANANGQQAGLMIVPLFIRATVAVYKYI